MAPDPMNPYKDAYAAPDGVGDGRPTALQVLIDNGCVSTYAGKVALITGGTNGIGLETVRALRATEADVYFTARSAEKAEKVRREILANSQGKGKLEVVMMDMDSLVSVRNAAKSFLSRSNKLNILINNAGIMNTPYSKTVDGFERQFGVNHLAHYLLTVLLLPVLEASSTPELKSRIVCVSSSSHRHSKVNFDDLTPSEENYNTVTAYGQSKCANIWMANYIDRVYGPRGVHCWSCGPGGIWTGILAFTDPKIVAAFKKDAVIQRNMQSAEQGCATQVWAATAKVLEGNGGKYLHDCTIAPQEDGDLFSVMSSKAAPWVKGDIAAEEKLWGVSAKLTGVPAYLSISS